MKYRSLSILTVILVFSLIFGTVPAVFAAEQTADIFYLEEDSSMMITISYTAGAPAVRFIDPMGTVYDMSSVSEGTMRMEDTGSGLVFWIPKASAGQWQMVYDKGANETIQVVWTPYVEGIGITDFTFTQRAEAPYILDVQLGVRYFEDSWYDYSIFAVVLDDAGIITGSELLYSGSGLTTQMEEVSVNVRDLPTFDEYYLLAEVSVANGIEEVVDRWVSRESFSYVNPDMPKAMEGVYIEIGVDDQYLKLDWGDFREYSSSYVVMVYADDAQEPFYINEFASSIHATEILLDTSISKLTVQIGYYTGYTEQLSQLLTREIDMSFAKAIWMEAEGSTANSAIKINYDVSGIGEDVKTVVHVNDTVQETLLSGSGTMTAKLDMFDNEVYVYWYLDDQTVFVTHRQVYYDNIAPSLILPEATSTIRTDQATYLLVGTTEAGCTVTVNDKQAQVDEAGCFSIQLALITGDNTFTVTARTPVGNASSQTITVIRLDAATGNVMDDIAGDAQPPIAAFMARWYSLIVAVLLGMLLLPLVLGGRKVFGKRRQNKGMLSAVLWIASMIAFYLDLIAAAFAGWGIWRYAANWKVLTSMDFYESANQSVTASYELLMRSAQDKQTMLIGIWICAGILLLAIGLLVASCVIAAVRKKKQDTA